MLSSITLTRHELVWETRYYTFDQADLDYLIRRYKRVVDTNDSDSVAYYNAQQILDVIGKLSLQDIIADFQLWYDGQPSISISQRRGGRKDQNYQFDDPLGEIIMDYLRDCCCESDVVDSNYADDYEELIDYGD